MGSTAEPLDPIRCAQPEFSSAQRARKMHASCAGKLYIQGRVNVEKEKMRRVSRRGSRGGRRNTEGKNGENERASKRVEDEDDDDDGDDEDVLCWSLPTASCRLPTLVEAAGRDVQPLGSSMAPTTAHSMPNGR